MMRRKPQFTSNQLKIADLILDRDTRKVTRAGNEIDLSAKEFMVLECLMRNKNIVMTRLQIEQNAWDFDFEGGSNVIDVYTVSYTHLNHAEAAGLLYLCISSGYGSVP